MFKDRLSTLGVGGEEGGRRAGRLQSGPGNALTLTVLGRKHARDHPFMTRERTFIGPVTPLQRADILDRLV